MRSIRHMQGSRRWRHGFRGYPKKYRKRKKFYIPNPAFDLEWIIRNARSIDSYFAQAGFYPFDYSSSLRALSSRYYLLDVEGGKSKYNSDLLVKSY